MEEELTKFSDIFNYSTDCFYSAMKAQAEGDEFIRRGLVALNCILNGRHQEVDPIVPGYVADSAPDRFYYKKSKKTTLERSRSSGRIVGTEKSAILDRQKREYMEYMEIAKQGSSKATIDAIKRALDLTKKSYLADSCLVSEFIEFEIKQHDPGVPEHSIVIMFKSVKCSHQSNFYFRVRLNDNCVISSAIQTDNLNWMHEVQIQYKNIQGPAIIEIVKDGKPLETVDIDINKLYTTNRTEVTVQFTCGVEVCLVFRLNRPLDGCMSRIIRGEIQVTPEALIMSPCAIDQYFIPQTATAPQKAPPKKAAPTPRERRLQSSR